MAISSSANSPIELWFAELVADMCTHLPFILLKNQRKLLRGMGLSIRAEVAVPLPLDSHKLHS